MREAVNPQEYARAVVMLRVCFVCEMERPECLTSIDNLRITEDELVVIPIHEQIVG